MSVHGTTDGIIKSCQMESVAQLKTPRLLLLRNGDCCKERPIGRRRRRDTWGQGKPEALPAEKEELWRAAMKNPDYKDVSSHLQCADPEGPAHGSVLPATDRSLR
jgi:hypothetical protein